MSDQVLRFPESFAWGVATAAHQVEGGNRHSDWWEFERSPGAIHDGSTSAVACDHWNRLEQDVELIAALNVKQYRFSVEWARVEPAPGIFDEQALKRYAFLVRLLRERGIDPLVTFHHFTLPRWVAENGGFQWDGIGDAFEKYVHRVLDHLGDRVENWITINEPQTLIAAGYIEGVFPPGVRDLGNLWKPAVGMLTAHARAYRVIHETARRHGRKACVGIAYHLRIFDPQRTWSPLDRWICSSIRQLSNWAMIEAVSSGRLRLRLPVTLDFDAEIPGLLGTQDFIGLNYYSRDRIGFDPMARGFIRRSTARHARLTDLGWEIHPEGLSALCREIHSRFPELPIHITESGLADALDRQRESFIREHLVEVHRVMSEGVPILGYSHWSLMDNFEWIEGYGPRFGLYEVDYSTQERRLRSSGRWYAELARTGVLSI